VRIPSSSFCSSSVCVSQVSFGSALNSSVSTSDPSVGKGKPIPVSCCVNP
jgi:hypothetical protein